MDTEEGEGNDLSMLQIAILECREEGEKIMFAIDREKQSTCNRCGKKFAAPSYTWGGSPMYGLCQECVNEDEEAETDNYLHNHELD